MPDPTLRLGQLYRGKVNKLVATSELAFIDIGLPRHAVLHQPHGLREGQSIIVRLQLLPVDMKGAVVEQVAPSEPTDDVVDLRPSHRHHSRQLSWQQQLVAALLIAGSFSVIWWLQP